MKTTKRDFLHEDFLVNNICQYEDVLNKSYIQRLVYSFNLDDVSKKYIMLKLEVYVAQLNLEVFVDCNTSVYIDYEM